MIQNPLRRKLQNKQTTYGLWVTLESPNVTELAVALGFDWVVVDTEHGHLDFREIMEHVRVVRGTETSAIVRIPEVQQGTIKRVLDIGAHGVILPMVGTGADVERAFRFGRYPPRGVRGVGGERAVKWGLEFDEYLHYANEETLLIPLIETQEAVENIDQILDVPGIEAIFFGPADMSSSRGFLGQWESPGVAEKILEIQANAATKGIASGILSRSVDESIKRRDQGFEMIALGADVNLLIRAVRENFAKLGRGPKQCS
ncbi:MAG: 2,4-dihydroxyhept-2-ene-1,7-dioic acid aldolase [Pedosphaera sp.]|nr:2,4-dihydroxyhept-2-ene-1,7-dioic acid aldolase [Pedosphaera sp.]